MAGTISLSLSQQLNQRGEPLAGGKLYLYAAGTTTPQNAFQDAALTIPLANPYTLDAAGRIPQFFLADGQIKVILTDNLGVTQLFADNLLVIGPSSGGGGGGSVDPTTVIQTGWIQPIYGTGVVSGFVRMNGRTIGNAVSGATERANADAQALFAWLYNQDTNLSVSGGRGASPLADFSAGKTILVPDWSGCDIRGLDDMGGGARGRLTTTVFSGLGPTVLGATAGVEKTVILQAKLPSIVAAGAVAITDPGHTHNLNVTGSGALGSGVQYGAIDALVRHGNPAAGALVSAGAHFSSTTGITASFNSGNIGGSGDPLPTTPPTRLCTIYIKL
jgi:hypothetical protein